MDLEKAIESTLFFKGEPVSIKNLGKLLDTPREHIEEALKTLGEKLSGRGIVLVRHEDEVTLATSPDTSGIIEKITKEELARDLGKAGLETLSIVLYHGPVARRDIDYIRGVNSNFILRNLLIRGLVEKVSNPEDQRAFLYKPTLSLLSFLGIKSIEDLPEYAQIKAELNQSQENPQAPTTTHGTE
ncbi:MAG: segregation and condensation protein segregation and condensation protein [Candidatus Parcubacteria bacterium]|jgi:segregation and condensation protein B